MDKKLSLKLNGGRHIQGILQEFNPFMNLVIDECVEMATSGQQNNIGMVVSKDRSFLPEISYFEIRINFLSINFLGLN